MLVLEVNIISSTCQRMIFMVYFPNRINGVSKGTMLQRMTGTFTNLALLFPKARKRILLSMRLVRRKTNLHLINISLILIGVRIVEVGFLSARDKQWLMKYWIKRSLSYLVLVLTKWQNNGFHQWPSIQLTSVNSSTKLNLLVSRHQAQNTRLIM